MPMTFDLDDIEISLREPALHDLIGSDTGADRRVTGAVDRLHVSTVSELLWTTVPGFVQRPRRPGASR